MEGGPLGIFITSENWLGMCLWGSLPLSFFRNMGSLPLSSLILIICSSSACLRKENIHQQQWWKTGTTNTRLWTTYLWRNICFFPCRCLNFTLKSFWKAMHLVDIKCFKPNLSGMIQYFSLTVKQHQPAYKPQKRSSEHGEYCFIFCSLPVLNYKFFLQRV